MSPRRASRARRASARAARGEAHEVAERAVTMPRRRSRGARDAIPSGRKHGGARGTPGTASPPAPRRARRARRSPVRVDAALARACRSARRRPTASPHACASRCRTVEPCRPGRLVEVDARPPRPRQRRERRRELRHRGPAEQMLIVGPCRATTPPAVTTAGGVCSAGHSSIWRSASTAGDTSSVERRLIPGHSPYEPVVGYSRAVVSGGNVHVSGTAPIPREGDPAGGRLRAGAAVPGDRRRRARRGGQRLPGRRADAHLPDRRRTTGRRSRAHTARSSRRSARPRPPSSSRGCSTRAGVSRSRPRPFFRT